MNNDAAPAKARSTSLRWVDVDLNAGIVRIIRSRHMWEDSAPKTGQAAAPSS